jgi:hypothetical protein
VARQQLLLSPNHPEFVETQGKAMQPRSTHTRNVLFSAVLLAPVACELFPWTQAIWIAGLWNDHLHVVLGDG